MGDAFKIKQIDVAQVRRHHVLHRAEHGFNAPRITLIPVAEHIGDHLALQVWLRTAQVARNNREAFGLGEALDVLFAAVGQRADDDVFAVVAHQLRRHPFHFAAVEHIQKQRLQDIVAMMAEGDLGRPELGGGTIEDAATQARAQRAGGFSFRDLLFDDAVGVLFDNLVFNPQLLQIRRQNMLREPWLLLIEVHRHQREGDGRAFLQIAQDLQHGIAVLAA